jgi:hypothetical protein
LPTLAPQLARPNNLHPAPVASAAPAARSSKLQLDLLCLAVGNVT